MNERLMTFFLGALSFIESLGVLSFIERHLMKIAQHIPFKTAKIFALKTAVSTQNVDVVEQLATKDLVGHLSKNQRDDILDDARAPLCLIDTEDGSRYNNALRIIQRFVHADISIDDKGFKNIAYSLMYKSATSIDHNILNLCGRSSINNDDKPDLFAWLITHPLKASTINNIFDMWKPHLHAQVHAQAMLKDHLQLTLLEVCCQFAPDHVLRQLTSNMDVIPSSQCSALLKRSQLSYETLEIFINKGVDIEQMVNKNLFGRMLQHDRADILGRLSISRPNISEAIETHYNNLDAQETRDEILEQVTVPEHTNRKRKM